MQTITDKVVPVKSARKYKKKFIMWRNLFYIAAGASILMGVLLIWTLKGNARLQQEVQDTEGVSVIVR